MGWAACPRCPCLCAAMPGFMVIKHEKEPSYMIHLANNHQLHDQKPATWFWVNYNYSLTWIVLPFIWGSFPFFIDHHSEGYGEQGSGVMIYPESLRIRLDRGGNRQFLRGKTRSVHKPPSWLGNGKHYHLFLPWWFFWGCHFLEMALLYQHDVYQFDALSRVLMCLLHQISQGAFILVMRNPSFLQDPHVSWAYLKTASYR